MYPPLQEQRGQRNLQQKPKGHKYHSGDHERRHSKHLVVLVIQNPHGKGGQKQGVNEEADLLHQVHIQKHNNLIASFGLDGRFGTWDWFKVQALAAIAMTAICVLILPRFMKNETAQVEGVEKRELKVSELPKAKQNLVYAIFIGTTLAMLLVEPLGLSWDNRIISLTGAALMVVTKCLTPKKALQSIDWSMLIMVASFLAVATGLANSGAAELIGTAITKLLGNNTSPLMVGIVFFIVSSLATQFLSNAACCKSIEPIAISVAMTLGLNPCYLYFIVDQACIMAIISELGAPSCAYTYRVAGYEKKEIMPFGVVMLVLFGALTIMPALLVFPS